MVQNSPIYLIDALGCDDDSANPGRVTMLLYYSGHGLVENADAAILGGTSVQDATNNRNVSQPELSAEELQDLRHSQLDIVGFIPGVGDFIDLFNAGLYFSEGKHFDGTLCIVSAAVPFFGDFAAKGIRAVRNTARGTSKALKQTDNVLSPTARVIENEAKILNDFQLEKKYKESL